MKSFALFLSVFAVIALLGACVATEPEPAPEPVETATASSADPLSGTWTGTWGPSAEHRNDVTLELAWDGTSLTGTVNPGPNAIEISNTSFDPATGAVTMEADAQNFRGETVHYMIAGQIDGETMTGSWIHDGGEGDFSISMN
jgi:hypothetical protein